MFYQYTNKNLLPTDYMKLSKGEKEVLKAFTYIEIENQTSGGDMNG